MLSRLKKDEKGFTLIELIMVIVILGIISAVAIPKFLSLSSSARTAAARGVGSAMSSTITNKHAAFLIDGTAYGANHVIYNTQMSGGIASAAVGAGAGATGTVRAANADLNASMDIVLNYKTKTFTWAYTARSGDTAATIAESGDNW